MIHETLYAWYMETKWRSYKYSPFYLFYASNYNNVGLANSRGSWVVGRMSWVVGRMSWVVGKKSWVVGKKSWVAGKKSWVVGKKSWVPNKMSWVPRKKSWVPNKKSWVLRKSWVPSKILAYIYLSPFGMRVFFLLRLSQTMPKYT